MKQLFFMIALVIPLQALEAWEVPPNPDPGVILNEAQADARAGRYEDALAKHLWFHHHALEHDRSYFGVRLSFALSDWYELGKAYPPALEKLKEIRDEAAEGVLVGKDIVREEFHDMSAINEHLFEEGRTVAVFVRLDKAAPKVAREVYDLAQPALVKAKKYALCGKYLEPEKSYAKMVELYRKQLEITDKKKTAESRRFSLDFAESYLIEQSATLVALLVLNDRKLDAEKIAEDARGESKHPARDATIDAALEGKLPKRWLE